MHSRDGADGPTRRESSGRILALRSRVVVIDSDPAVRSALTSAFEPRYEIISCATAEEGVQAVDAYTCTVILEVKIGDVDGFSLCDEIRKKVPDIPVIFYSTYQNLKDPYAVINQHRPFGYVTKSQDLQSLIETVDMAVKLQSIIINNRKLIESLTKARTPPR